MVDSDSPRIQVNPLREYLLDLQSKRVRLVEALAPRRHLATQAWIAAFFVSMWALDVAAPALGGLPMVLVILIGPFILAAGPFMAGWDAQLLAAKNYPSPLDSPQALELLLTTPLTEKELVTATVGAFGRYPFIGWKIGRFALILAGVAIWLLALASAHFRGTLPTDILFMAINFYSPAFCVFIFFPVLSALDLLFVPSGWLKRSPDEPVRAAESVWGRSGRLPMIAMALSLAPVVARANQLGALKLSTVRWVLTCACPLVLLGIGAATAALILLLPGHLARLRRG